MMYITQKMAALPAAKTRVLREREAPGGGAIKGGADAAKHGLRLIPQKIADSADGADEGPVGFAIHFIAQAVDVHIHNIRGGVDAHLPDVVEDHGAGDDAAGVAAEVFEQGELLLGELELRSRHGGLRGG